MGGAVSRDMDSFPSWSFASDCSSSEGKPGSTSRAYPWFMQPLHHLFCSDCTLPVCLGSLLMVLYYLFKLAWWLLGAFVQHPAETKGVTILCCSLHMGGSGLSPCICRARMKKGIYIGKPWHIYIKMNFLDPVAPFLSDLKSEDVGGMSQGLGSSPGASAWCNKVMITASNYYSSNSSESY